MSRPMWLVAVIRKTFPGRFTMAKMTRLPGIGRLVEKALFEGDDIIILPREEGVILAQEHPGDAGSAVVPSRVVEHFIEKASHLFVMNTCICREAAGCDDYPVDIGCLFMGEAVLGINPALGRQVTKEEARAHLARSRRAGLFHLVGRNKLDTVWLGVSPGTRLLTVCNCCPCCCLWRILPDVAGRIGSRVTGIPGLSVTVGDNCTGCGTCEAACYVKAITTSGGHAEISDACRGCGQCATVCPEGAITVTVEDPDLVERAVERLSRIVDVGG